MNSTNAVVQTEMQSTVIVHVTVLLEVLGTVSTIIDTKILVRIPQWPYIRFAFTFLSHVWSITLTCPTLEHT